MSLKPSMALQNVFDEGHAIHDKWQTRFYDMGNLYGEWQCVNCSHSWWAQSPTKCSQCEKAKSFIKYREVKLKSLDKYRIAGQADGWIKGIGKETLIEIKSIGFGTVRMESPNLAALADGHIENAWGMIKAPFKTHRRQGALYLELGHQMVEAGVFKSFPEEIVFIYECKANQAVKEFTVSRTPEVVEDVFIAAESIVSALDTNTPVPCNIDPVNCSKCNKFKENNE
jgi:hypothetical protein